jgi:hypothetical protein
MPRAQRWIRAAATLPFQGAANDDLVPIDRLAAQADRFDGQLVAVEGTVQALTITHRRGKTISRALLQDGAASVPLLLAYIKLDAGGMVAGAAVRATGTWHASSPESDGPALHLARRNFGASRKENWRDWATSELAPVLEPVPHGLAASWSWQPGIDGAGNPLRYGVWHRRSKERFDG